MITDLQRFVGLTVLIVVADGKNFLGKVTDYFYPDDNENGIESIVIDTIDGSLVEFSREDILTIKVI